MPYDPELLETDQLDVYGPIDVWYDGRFLGTVDNEEEAHELAVNYALGSN